MVVFTLFTGVLFSVVFLISLILKFVFYRSYSGNFYKYLLIPKHLEGSVAIDSISNILLLSLFMYISRDIDDVFFEIFLGIIAVIGFFILNNIVYYFANLKRNK